MTAKELREHLSKLANEYQLEYYVKREDGELMTVRFLVKENKNGI